MTVILTSHWSGSCTSPGGGLWPPGTLCTTWWSLGARPPSLASRSTSGTAAGVWPRLGWRVRAQPAPGQLPHRSVRFRTIDVTLKLNILDLQFYSTTKSTWAHLYVYPRRYTVKYCSTKNELLTNYNCLLCKYIHLIEFLTVSIATKNENFIWIPFFKSATTIQ